MTLDAGTKLGQYEILEPIGKGGMGEVYRARDTKLGREVAIKILLEELSKDRERRDRFEREAKLLASLNHPAIATLYGFEDGFLIMELVDGETLAERIARGAIPVDEAVPLFIHIAEGLEAAHEKAIIHRDLKPANIKIGPDGKPKILDFGLAKAFAREEDVSAEASQSPTLTKGTALGIIMGTASYMSPEQARGKPVDKRTDVFAFGCCLYEALTAKKAFDGETVTDIIAAVVNKEPRWEDVPDSTPRSVRDLLKRCLRKNPRDRVRDIGDARISLGEAISPEPADGAPAPSPTTRRLATALLMLGALGVGWLLRSNTDSNAVSRQPSHLALELQPADALGVTSPSRTNTEVAPLTRTAFTLSPDGRDIVFAGRQGEQQLLFRRSLGESEAQPFAGVERAVNPVFSPDGEWIAFWSEGQLKKVSFAGGPAVPIFDVKEPTFGLSWRSDESIVFARRRGGLWIVSSNGGDPTMVTGHDIEAPLVSHRLPWMLPEGDVVLYTEVVGNQFAQAKIIAQSLSGGDSKILIAGATHPMYTATGHLLYAKLGVLWAVPFDADTLELAGDPVPVVGDIVQSVRTGSIYEDTRRRSAYRRVAPWLTCPVRCCARR